MLTHVTDGTHLTLVRRGDLDDTICTQSFQPRHHAIVARGGGGRGNILIRPCCVPSVVMHNNTCALCGPSQRTLRVPSTPDFSSLALTRSSSSRAVVTSSPPGRYTQDIPDLYAGKLPPLLPPHLLEVTLNSEPLGNDPTQLPEPNHVVLNHLYALSIKVSAVAHPSLRLEHQGQRSGAPR